MDREESLELLNAAHKFPCPFTLKVIGKQHPDFVNQVLEAVRDTLGMDTLPEFTSRETANQKHVSVTVEPTIQSAEQVLEAYARLRTIPGVVMTM